MSNQYSADVPKGFNVPKQVRLDSITGIQNEETLKNLGTGNNLAFKYYDGLKVRCKDEKTEYIWREVVGLETGLLDIPFTYPTYPAVDGIDYSGKVYNFFEVPTSNIIPPDGSETKLIEGTNITITGTGTTLDPYEISADSQTSQTYINEGDNINITGIGTLLNPFVINADLTDLGIVKTVDDEVIAPGQTLAIINGESTGKVLTTKEYVQSIIPTAVDGSETKINAGNNVTITGTGTTLTPYIINSLTQNTPTYINSGTDIEVVGVGSIDNPYIINSTNSQLDTKVEFNERLTDGDFLFVGDVTQYTDELVRDVIGASLVDTDTIDFIYNDGLNTISAEVKPNSIEAIQLANNINVSEFINDANYATNSNLALKENTANKQNSLVVDGTGTKFPTVDAINLEVVKLTGNQTVLDKKAFNKISVGTPTSDIIGHPTDSFNADLSIKGSGVRIENTTGESLIVNTTAYAGGSHFYDANVLAIQNKSTYLGSLSEVPSAIRFLSNTDGEMGAIGYQNGAVGTAFANSMFLAASMPYYPSNPLVAPTRLALIQEGDYLGLLTKIERLEFNSDWSTKFKTPNGTPRITIPVEGRVLINNATDNLTDDLQINGSLKATTLKGNSLTSNLVLKATTNGQITNSTITDNGTNVGIGNASTSPAENLEVRTTGNVGFAMTRNTSTNAARFYFRTGSTYNWSVGIRSNRNDYSVYNEVLGVEPLTINSTTSNVLIGSTTDNAVDKLQVTGTASSGTTTLGNTPPTVNNQLTRKDYVDTGLALKADIASPSLTGTPTAPTATVGTNTTQIATTAFVQNAMTSGTYVPTFTNTTNISSSTLNAAYYTKINNIITVTIAVQLTLTATADTVFTFSLPVSGATVVNGVGQGNLTSGGGSVNAYGIVDTTNSTTAQLRIGSAAVAGSGAGVANIIFTYSL